MPTDSLVTAATSPSSTSTVAISDSVLRDARSMLRETIGVQPTDSDLRAILADETQLQEDILRFGWNDTETKSKVASLVAVVLVDRPLPTYGEVRQGLDISAFYEQLSVAAETRGWTVL